VAFEQLLVVIKREKKGGRGLQLVMSGLEVGENKLMCVAQEWMEGMGRKVVL